MSVEYLHRSEIRTYFTHKHTLLGVFVQTPRGATVSMDRLMGRWWMKRRGWWTEQRTVFLFDMIDVAACYIQEQLKVTFLCSKINPSNLLTNYNRDCRHKRL